MEATKLICWWKLLFKEGQVHSARKRDDFKLQVEQTRVNRVLCMNVIICPKQRDPATLSIVKGGWKDIGAQRWLQVIDVVMGAFS